jgi:8-oxo-dGTP diphosphatase
MRRQYPLAPIPSVGAVVWKGHKVLLVRRGHEPSKGKWSIPGGALELGETLQEAAQREVKEECGIQIDIGNVVEVRDSIFRDQARRVRFHYVLVDLEARYLSGELTVGSDAEDARWVSEEELAGYDLSAGLLPVLQRCFRAQP